MAKVINHKFLAIWKETVIFAKNVIWKLKWKRGLKCYVLIHLTRNILSSSSLICNSLLLSPLFHLDMNCAWVELQVLLDLENELKNVCGNPLIYGDAVIVPFFLWSYCNFMNLRIAKGSFLSLGALGPLVFKELQFFV